MGSSLNKFVKKAKNANSVEAKVERGEGKMVDGAYQAYSDADKVHIKNAEMNKYSAYEDISAHSGLKNFFGASNTLLGSTKRRKQSATPLLGGGSSILGG